MGGMITYVTRFPRLYAAASLKPARSRRTVPCLRVFSAALCRGLIEASRAAGMIRRHVGRFPRLYAAASLKRSRSGFPFSQ